MILKNIEILNVRNIEKQTIEFKNGINVFIGPNGAGKTSILESIYLLGLTKSHRTSDIQNVINFGNSNLIINGVVRKKNINHQMNFKYIDNKKQVYIDNNKKLLPDYIGFMNVISFTPSDFELVKGAPKERRKYLDTEISQLNKDYLKKLNEYNVVLKMKRNYLKSNIIIDNADKYLETLNEKLSSLAALVLISRLDFLSNLNEVIGDVYYYLSGIKGIKLDYKTSFDHENLTKEEIEKEFIAIYRTNARNEIAQRSVLYGPHRDEFVFSVDNHDLKYFGSQGQIRLACLALKLSEINIFKNITGDYPIVLLDDLFSELDKEKKNKLMKFLDNEVQVIITTNDLVSIEEDILEKSYIQSVMDGVVKE